MRSILLSIWLLARAQAQIESYDFGVAIEPLTRRQAGPIIVGGLPLAPDGSVPHRLEIREMRANEHQWDLFILALSMFQSVSQDDPLSWYQVAGIHGVPFQTWNGVDPVPGASMSGYCPHGSVLFPTWHRPYLALVEQELYRLATFIATLFPTPAERMLYEQAASTFRLPYWDWALAAPPGQPHLPEFFWHPTVVQYGPRGEQMIRNPLYSYKFHPVDEGALLWAPFRMWDETKRAPAVNVSLNSPPSVNQDVDAAFRQELPVIQEKLFAVLTTRTDFNSFGTTAWASMQGLVDRDSIESIHNVVHGLSGLGGHMSFVPLSSFDPIFFLHHVTMDRQIAMWQVLNPTAWIVPMEALETSYTTLKGTTQTSRTPLTPFYINDNGTFWDSDMARSTIVFGYAYAETDPTETRTEPHADSLRRTIEALYRGSRRDVSEHFTSTPRRPLRPKNSVPKRRA